MSEVRMVAFSGYSRVADYLFGRNAPDWRRLPDAASNIRLCHLERILDFILGVQTTPGSAQLREFGGLSLSTELFVIAIVIAPTFLIWISLRETFGAQRLLIKRLITFPLYLFLVLWSFGFGYGLWWSLFPGEEATSTSLSGLQEDARDASAAIAARLDAVKIQLDNVVTWSEGQMSREESSGGSCGIPSGSGRGPLYNSRRSVRDQVACLRDGIVTSWLGPIQKDLDDLNKSASKFYGGTIAER